MQTGSHFRNRHKWQGEKTMQSLENRVLWLTAAIAIIAFSGCISSDPVDDTAGHTPVATEEIADVGAVQAKTSVEEVKTPIAELKAEPEPPAEARAVPEPEVKPKVDISKKKMTFETVDISALYNASAVGGEKGIDGHGNAYPADKLPRGKAVSFGGDLPEGLVFSMPNYQEAEKNVITADGQTIKVSADTYCAIFLLTAATNSSQMARMKLGYVGAAAGADEMLKVSDWCGAPKFGEIEAAKYDRVSGENEAAKCRLFVQVVVLEADKKLEAITLPVNANMLIFAVTLAK